MENGAAGQPPQPGAAGIPQGNDADDHDAVADGNDAAGQQPGAAPHHKYKFWMYITAVAYLCATVSVFWINLVE